MRGPVYVSDFCGEGLQFRKLCRQHGGAVCPLGVHGGNRPHVRAAVDQVGGQEFFLRTPPARPATRVPPCPATHQTIASKRSGVLGCTNERLPFLLTEHEQSTTRKAVSLPPRPLSSRVLSLSPRLWYRAAADAPFFTPDLLLMFHCTGSISAGGGGSAGCNPKPARPRWRSSSRPSRTSSAPA